MKVSVIVPTYNGAHKLPAIIKALKDQTWPPCEVLVAVDGSTDDTVQVLQQLKPSLPSLKIIEQENKGRSAVRNAGAAQAEGGLLVFFDDDMIPLPNCIEKHVQHHKDCPHSILTGGLYEPYEKNSPDILKYKSFLSKKWNAQLKTDKGRLEGTNLFITAANFSILRNDFHAMGGFDERLNDAEDFDLAIRAFRAGFPLYFKEEVFAWHNEVITCRKYINRQRQYTVANQKLVCINPWLAADKYIVPLKQPVGWRKLLFQLFLNKMWIRAVDNNVFRVLPRKLKYKLYDLIITANGVYYPDKVPL